MTTLSQVEAELVKLVPFVAQSPEADHPRLAATIERREIVAPQLRRILAIT